MLFRSETVKVDDVLGMFMGKGIGSKGNVKNVYTSAGRLGADTDSIFHDLGYTDPEIAAMKASGAIQ